MYRIIVNLIIGGRLTIDEIDIIDKDKVIVEFKWRVSQGEITEEDYKKYTGLDYEPVVETTSELLS